jgi:hypothetical protein
MLGMKKKIAWWDAKLITRRFKGIKDEMEVSYKVKWGGLEILSHKFCLLNLRQKHNIMGRSIRV